LGSNAIGQPFDPPHGQFNDFPNGLHEAQRERDANPCVLGNKDRFIAPQFPLFAGFATISP
jgi:hypothetical protein